MKSYHPQGTPPVSFRGKQTPATGVNKCSNPDEGTLNEVSSLANEKFISSRNKYGAKRKAVLVSVGTPHRFLSDGSGTVGIMGSKGSTP